MVLRISLLGRPTVEAGSVPVTIVSQKAKALLWYLASQPNQEFGRSHLASLLWTNSTEQEGRQSLSTTLNRLRQALPCWPIQTHNDHLSWCGSNEVWVDTTRFCELSSCSADVAALEEAASLWRGPFLEGAVLPNAEGYETWLQQQTLLWENRVLQVLTALVQTHQARGDWAKAIDFARRTLLIDPLQERMHQALMTCYYFAGDRGAALAQYAACERILRNQLGVAPDDSTRQLRDAIADGTLPHSGLQQAAPLPQAPVEVTSPPHDPVIGRQTELTLLQKGLAEGSSILICGPTGQGKSALVREVLRPGSSLSFATVVQARCCVTWSTQPLWPVLQALHMSIHLAEENLPNSQLVKAVEERLRALPGPVLLIIEDLHWSDNATFALLEHLLHLPSSHRPSLLLTSRDWELPTAHYLQLRHWEREGLLTWLDLAALSGDDFATLVRSRVETADAAFIRLLQEDTGGNPLFTLTLLEAIGRAPPALLPTSPQQLPLPPYLLCLVRERVQSLSPRAAELLKAAAVTREGLSLHELQHLTGLETLVILEALDELLGSQLVDEDPDSDRIRVPVGFVRRAVTSMISQTRRRHLLSSLEAVRTTGGAICS